MRNLILGVFVCLVFALPANAQDVLPESEYYTQANDAFDTANYKQAIELYTGLVENYPTSADVPHAYTFRGYAYQNLGDFEFAQRDFTNAIEASGGDYALAWAGRAENNIFYLEDPEAGLNDINRAIDVNPSRANYHYTQASAYWDLDDFDSAETAFREAIALDVRYELAWYWLGELYERQDRLGEAIVAYTGAVSADPTYDSAYLSRGIAYERLDFHPLAGSDFNLWMSLNETTRETFPLMRSAEEIEIDVIDGGVYLVPYEGTTGERIDIAANGTEGTDPLLVVLADDGAPIYGDDDIDEDDFDALILGFVMPSPNVTLVVGQAGAGGDGTITLAVTPSTPAE